MLLIAEVLKPQGIKGEVKVKSFLDSFADYSNIKEVIINGQTVAIEKIRGDGLFAYIKLKGIEDRNAAEALRGISVFVAEDNRPALKEGRYYISDIIGCKIAADGLELGVVDEVIQNGSADVYSVAGKKPFLFAVIDGVITNFDIAAKTLTVDLSELKKVAVYED